MCTELLKTILLLILFIDPKKNQKTEGGKFFFGLGELPRTSAAFTVRKT